MSRRTLMAVGGVVVVLGVLAASADPPPHPMSPRQLRVRAVISTAAYTRTDLVVSPVQTVPPNLAVDPVVRFRVTLPAGVPLSLVNTASARAARDTGPYAEEVLPLTAAEVNALKSTWAPAPPPGSGQVDILFHERDLGLALDLMGLPEPLSVPARLRVTLGANHTLVTSGTWAHPVR